MALVFHEAARAQISPGPLTRAHQNLEGVSNCATCHNFGTGLRALKCLECHTEIQRRTVSRTGYHGRAVRASQDERDCARCHLEHNGQNFPLIRFDPKTFQHGQETGFVLEGKHATLECSSCHNSKKIPPGALDEIKVKDRNHSYLGLKRECVSCHQDQHRGQVGTNCTQCHTLNGWKPASGFDHSRAKFVLTGSHQSVACVKCHGPQAGESGLQFKGVDFKSCQTCHKDPHRGAFQEAKFRGGCESCHNTTAWKGAKPSTGFRHQQTKFALDGKHTEVACFRCHKDVDFHTPVAHDRCQNCHEDAHSNQFVARAAGSDCGSCHDVNGFKPTMFDRQAHQRSAFRLEGKHAELECARCHAPAGKSTVYAMGRLPCADCHVDPHAGEFSGPPNNNRCDLCHTQESFHNSRFSVERHSQTKFALTGKHAEAKCESCHKPVASPVRPVEVNRVLSVVSTVDASRQYHFSSTVCASCHQDPHGTKLACETCHVPNGWKSVAPFDHSMTAFKLDGSHAQVACAKCHKPRETGGGLGFHGTVTACSGCHQKDSVHGLQFQTATRQEDCVTCHVPSKWKIEQFDHEKTLFPLDRAHRNVACEKCHKEQTALSSGPASRIYRGTPTECVRCH